MANYQTITTAVQSIRRVSEAELTMLTEAIQDTGLELEMYQHSAEPIEYEVYLYAYESLDEEELERFALVLGPVISRDETLPGYLEFGIAFTCDKARPDSHGGTAFRIHKDGTIEWRIESFDSDRLNWLQRIINKVKC